MPLIDGRTTRILFTISLFAIGLGFLYVARRTLIAFMFAVFFAYLVDPGVSRVEKWTKGRGSAIAVIYVLIVLFLGTFFFFVGPKIGHEAQKLTESLPGLLAQVTSGQLAEQLGAEHGLSVATRHQLGAFLASHRDDLVHLAQRAGLRIAELAQQSWLLIVVPILAGFFLKDGRVGGSVSDSGSCAAYRFPLAGGPDFPGCLARYPGLCCFAASDGQKHGTASARCYFRRPGGRRNCRSARCLSFDSRDGQPANCVAAVAHVR